MKHTTLLHSLLLATCWLGSSLALAAPATPAAAATSSTTTSTTTSTPAATAPQAGMGGMAADLAKLSAAMHRSTADHSKFKELQQKFKSGPEVTKACLACHTEAASQVQHTKHWTWEYTNPRNGQKVGKKNLINNYCTSTVSNEKDCMACHAGYGWQDKAFDFTRQDNVDCLVCHDSTGTYRKLPGDAGHPVYERREFPPGSGKFVEAVDLGNVAQHVAMPSRGNCGTCHFNGAGGDGTKHGDLDSSLKKPGRYLDVHMDVNGLNFSCVTCHKTSGHEVSGSRYTMTSGKHGAAAVRGKADEAPASCQSCHGDKPHKENALLVNRLNSHTDKLACQTCHIPEYARNAVGTEKSWDWSTATRMGADGKPMFIKDSAGKRAFDSKKGNFAWDSYLIPEYRWFNGEFVYKVRGDKIDPTQTVEINHANGGPNDPDSRIWPMKIHRGKQAYDVENKTLIVAHTAGEDDTALWHNYDWDKAIKTGMETAGLPYSGKFGFVSTEMSWGLAHMVAPKEDAVQCIQCHKEQGRLQGLNEGIYLPGRDGSRLIDFMGWAMVLLALLGSLIHGGVRYYVYSRRAQQPAEH